MARIRNTETGALIEAESARREVSTAICLPSEIPLGLNELVVTAHAETGDIQLLHFYGRGFVVRGKTKALMINYVDVFNLALEAGIE